MKINWNSKTSRRTVSVFIVIMVAFVVIPGAVMEQSFNAIINSRIVAIHSPIEGVVVNFDKQPGEAVTQDKTLLTINNRRLNESFIKELRVEQNSLKERVHGFESHIDELEKLMLDLQQRQSEMIKFEVTRVEQQLKEAESEIRATQELLEERKRYLNRIAPLAKQGIVPMVEFDKVTFSIKEYEHRIVGLEATAERVRTEKNALERGIHLGQGRNDVPYTQQRMDEVRMNLSDYRARKIEQIRRIEEIDQQIADEERRLQLNRSVDIKSPLDGILWKKFFTNGSEISIGSELAQVVDCNTMFIDSEYSESKLNYVNLGQEVKYRLYGDKIWHRGIVINKSGSGNQLSDRTLAAQLNLKKDSARLTIKINPTDIHKTSEDFCQIGRRVEVVTPRKIFNFSWINRITGLF
jgi:multidrug resistance efflux pump